MQNVTNDPRTTQVTKPVTQEELAAAAKRVAQVRARIRVREADIQQAIPEAIKQIGVPEPMAQFIPLNHPCGGREGLQKVLIRRALHEAGEYCGENYRTDLVQAAVQSKDVRIMRAVLAHLVRDLAKDIAYGDVEARELADEARQPAGCAS